MTPEETRMIRALTDPLNEFAPTLTAAVEGVIAGVDVGVGLFDYRAIHEAIADRTTEIMAPEYMTAWVAAGEVLHEVPADLTLLSRVWASQRSAELVTTLADRAVVRSVVLDGIGRGMSVDRVARLLRGSIGLDARSGSALARFAATAERPSDVTRYAEKLTRNRAELIARTEIQGAVNAGRQAAWQRAAARGAVGPMTFKTWVTAHDERVCSECGPMDGESVPLFDSFSFGGDMPPRHPRCRCTAVLDVS